MALLLEDPTATLEKVEAFRRERLLVTEEIADLDRDAAARAALAEITDDQVAAVLLRIFFRAREGPPLMLGNCQIFQKGPLAINLPVASEGLRSNIRFVPMMTP